MGKALYLESVAGVAGDMFAASFVDAGLVSVKELDSLAGKIGLDGVTVVVETVIKATVKATRVNVKWQTEAWKNELGHGHGHGHSHKHEDNNLLLGHDAVNHWHTHYEDIVSLLSRSSLDTESKVLSLKIFQLLAEAEADAHGIAIDKVAFHEVGTIDSIMDVVMAAHCVIKIGAKQIFATPVKPGRGSVIMQHGTHPIPPPASIRLLVGMPVAKTPDTISRENVELSTPTGIAILKALSPHFVNEMPAGTLVNQGMGAGTMDLGNYPNVFRVSLIDSISEPLELQYETDRVVEIVCNIDDDTGEHLAWMTEKLLEQTAIDVWQTAATGKKGRILVCLSVLVGESHWAETADWLLRNSTTFGIRHRIWNRLKLVRHFERRQIEEKSVNYKIGSTTDGEKLKEKGEFDELFS